MSSLWSLIKKQRIGFVSPFTKESVADLMRKPPEAKLLTVTDHLESWLAEPESYEFDMANMDATPPFATLWMEWLHSDYRNGILIVREEVEDSRAEGLAASAAVRFHLRMTMFNDEEGYAIMRGGAEFHIDRLGCLCGQTVMACAQDNQGATTFRLLFACNILTTINTRGTRIDPPWDSKSVTVVRPDRAPCSVWRQVIIPKFQGPPLQGAEISDTILERREHWVRAHRRDYRRGAGMFGRVKALVWVPEFQRGNPELGTVKQSYEVHRQ